MEIDQRKAAAGFVVILSIIVMLVGLIGMVLCSFFIWSSSQVEVIGAGLGFVTGAIMIGAGLITVALVAGGMKSHKP